jgi:hypothetical protein
MSYFTVAGKMPVFTLTAKRELVHARLYRLQVEGALKSRDVVANLRLPRRQCSRLQFGIEDLDFVKARLRARGKEDRDT